MALMSTNNDLSVIICTHNPDRSLLKEVLSAVASQDLTQKYEIVIVDNASNPPVLIDHCNPVEDRALIVSEPKVGLSNARSTGIISSTAPIIVFIDDDNIVSENYLSTALDIAKNRKKLGVFAGRTLGRFATTPSWLHRAHLKSYAIRDLGDQSIEGLGGSLESWEPFGAGMVVRREVANAFVELNAAFEMGVPLGRHADSILSGEDSLFSLLASRLGYNVGYQPQLILEHVIPKTRLTYKYLFKLIEAQGRAEALLRGAQGDLYQATKPEPFTFFLARRFLSRLKHPGLHEALTHLYWDKGYFDELSRLDGPPVTHLAEALETVRRSNA